MTDTMLTLDGITQPINDWALDYGIYPAVIAERLERGWSAERAVTTPMIVAPGQRLERAYMPGLISSVRKRIGFAGRNRTGKRITYNGRCLTVRQWSAELGLSTHTIDRRIRLGLPLDEVFGPLKTGGRPRGKPGVGKNLPASKGTGGGSTTQIST